MVLKSISFIYPLSCSINSLVIASPLLCILNGKPCRKYLGTGFHISIAMVYRNPNFFYHKIISPFFFILLLYAELPYKATFFQKNILSAAFCYRQVLSFPMQFYLHQNSGTSDQRIPKFHTVSPCIAAHPLIPAHLSPPLSYKKHSTLDGLASFSESGWVLLPD